MKLLLLSFFFIGIIMIILGFYTSQYDKPKTKIIYKFLDQTIEEKQQGDKESLLKLYQSMFKDHSILT